MTTKVIFKKVIKSLKRSYEFFLYQIIEKYQNKLKKFDEFSTLEVDNCSLLKLK